MWLPLIDIPLVTMHVMSPTKGDKGNTLLSVHFITIASFEDYQQEGMLHVLR